MSKPLDELREMLRADIVATLHTSSNCVENIWYVAGMEDALVRLDAFEAAHPGLADLTERCADCHRPKLRGDRWPQRETGILRCEPCARKATP